MLPSTQAEWGGRRRAYKVAFPLHRQMVSEIISKFFHIFTPLPRDMRELSSIRRHSLQSSVT